MKKFRTGALAEKNVGVLELGEFSIDFGHIIMYL